MEHDALQQPTTNPTNQCPQCGLAVSATQSTCPVDGTPLNQCLPGFILDGKYEFIELIGSGGMGVIYKARQIILNRPVAVKMLHSHMISDKALMRFQREGKAGSALSHQNITVVLDFALSEHGQPYMVMDYEVGQTLAQMIESQAGLSQTFVVESMIQVCQGLAHAHARGVLHRDLKPSNLMVVADTKAPVSDSKATSLIKILDFGIAKIIEDGDSKNKQLTRTGETMGSPPYMSPEQAIGGSNVDKRSDLYSLGCVIFECLSGTPPFMAESVFNILIAHGNQQPPTLKEASLGTAFPDELERIVKKLLEKKPADRYQSAEELEADLQRFKRGQSAPSEKIVLDKRHNALPVPATIAIAAGVITLLIAGFFLSPFLHPGAKIATKGDRNSATKSRQADSSTAKETDSLKSVREPDILEGKAFVLNYLARHDGTNFIELGSGDIKDQDLEPLEQQTNCQRIDLQNNLITGPGLTYLSKLKKLSSLRIDHNDIHDDALKYLVGLPKLATLDLSSNKNITGTGFSHFGKKNELYFLNLRNTGIADQGLSYLASFGSIFGISLAQTNIDAKGMSALASVKNLRCLNLSNTHIGKSGLATLCKKNPYLLTLFLTGVEIGNDSVPSLLQLKNLDSLDVSGTNITGEGIQQLAELKNLKTLWCGSCKAGYVLGRLKELKPQLIISEDPRKEDYSPPQVSPNSLGDTIK